MSHSKELTEFDCGAVIGWAHGTKSEISSILDFTESAKSGTAAK